MNTNTQSTVNECTQEFSETTLDLRTTAIQTIDEALHEVIAEAAYFLAQQRDFADGHALDDWLEAEAQIDAMSEK